MSVHMSLRRMVKLCFGLSLGFMVILHTGVQAWSKEGHAMVCEIAQHTLFRCYCLTMSTGICRLCVCTDQIRHWYKYPWTSPVHFIDTPDEACNFHYKRDCHDPHGVKDMCVAGAIKNYTTQLSHYRHGTSDRRRKKWINVTFEDMKLRKSSKIVLNLLKDGDEMAVQVGIRIR